MSQMYELITRRGKCLDELLEVHNNLYHSYYNLNFFEKSEKELKNYKALEDKYKHIYSQCKQFL